LPSKLRGFRFLPRQVCLLLDTSAFPGRTTVRATFAAYSSSIGQRALGKHAAPPIGPGVRLSVTAPVPATEMNYGGGGRTSKGRYTPAVVSASPPTPVG